MAEPPDAELLAEPRVLDAFQQHHGAGPCIDRRAVARQRDRIWPARAVGHGPASKNRTQRAPDLASWRGRSAARGVCGAFSITG